MIGLYLVPTRLRTTNQLPTINNYHMPLTLLINNPKLRNGLNYLSF